MMLINWWEIVFYSLCLVTLIQLFYYLWFFMRLAFFKPKSQMENQQHPVSVVICARDEAANLEKNLPGICVQSYPTTHEIVVVNDNSVDESKYLLDGMSKIFRNLRVQEIKQDAKLISGKKYPLSVGIKSAKHEVMLLTDADCVPSSEHWIYKMQEAYRNGVEIVLGYGAYHKAKGILNKIIRFETFHTALQYLSYALAGIPYMGVGRNLSYKREIFFRHKGFSSINHIISGDDDLFINLAANKKNTTIVIDPETFTLSEPKKKWSDWVNQKTRHYSTGKFYKPLHKFLLSLYTISFLLYYPLLIVCAIFYSWKLALIVFGIRFIIQGFVYFKTMRKLNEMDLWILYPLLDVWMFFYYLLFVPALWIKPRENWN